VVKILLVRHGQTDWNKAEIVQGREDIPLNDTGREQARITAECIVRNFPGTFAKICTSPLSRAKETADFIVSAAGCPLEIRENLIERDYGAVSGMPIAQRDRLYPGRDYPDAESLFDTGRRIKSELTELAEQGENFAAVLHSGAINAFLTLITDGKSGTGKTKLPPASITELSFDKGEFKVVYAGKICG
jgi:uncharacterized phosphatase